MSGDADGEIIRIRPDSGTYTEGGSVNTSADVKNKGDSRHTFFVGYSVHGPDGGTYDNGGSTGQRVTVDTGESRRVYLSWTVEGRRRVLPPSNYD